MYFIPFPLICFVLFLGWFFLRQRKSGREEQEASDAFWAREAEANHTRNKDISHIPLIHVTEAELPVIDTNDKSITRCTGQLREIIQNPMTDLSEYTNTDLKLSYGVGNFKLLSEYDENFNHFLSLLSELAAACARADLLPEAEQTYRLALHYGSQKQSDYTGLAEVCLRLDQPEKVDQLMSEVSTTHPHRDSILQTLQEVLTQYQ